MEHYTVLTYNIGGYEKMHEIKEKSPNAEYLYITDDESLESETWEMVYVNNPHPEDPFALCYDIRFDPWSFSDTDIIVRVDGSIVVEKNMDELVQAFIDGDYDIAFPLHPMRNTMLEEYRAWVLTRGYDINQANRCLKAIQDWFKYDVLNYKGQGQYNFMIQKRNRKNLLLNEGTLWTLKMLAPEGKQIERIDQTIGNVILQHFFKDMKVMPLSVDITDGLWTTWMGHGTDIPIPYTNDRIDPYYFNEPVQFHPLGVKNNGESV